MNGAFVAIQRPSIIPRPDRNRSPDRATEGMSERNKAFISTLLERPICLTIASAGMALRLASDISRRRTMWFWNSAS